MQLQPDLLGNCSIRSDTYRDLDHVGDQGTGKHARHQPQYEVVHLPPAWSAYDVPGDEDAGRATC